MSNSSAIAAHIGNPAAKRSFNSGRFMTHPLDDQAQTRMALAALVAALAQTLDGSHPGSAKRFREAVERIYNDARDRDVPMSVLETLGWARQASKELDD